MLIQQILHRLRLWIVKILWILLLISLLTGSSVPLYDPAIRVRRFTRQIEFDFLDWTLDALRVKLELYSLGVAAYLLETERQALVQTYLDLVTEIRDLETQLAQVYSDPDLVDPVPIAELIITERNAVWDRQFKLQPIVETVLQEHVASVLADLGLNPWGAPFPPVAFRFTRPPVSLIISPRHVISQEHSISIDPNLALENHIALEAQVEGALDVSALVVPVGGIGIYPTMIQETSSVVWLTETIVHEWVHNYLTLRPLGLNYYTNSELRTMNETTASLLGREIGRKVLERYYPAHVSPPQEASPPAPLSPVDPPKFDFRAEMYQTRVVVDELLEQGDIEEAETYMEARRQIFWQNGYYIRRINQAYFAFHGAYADQPGGAAGDDPVGIAVRELWALIDSPVEFLRTMAWMNDFSDLQVTLLELKGSPEP